MKKLLAIAILLIILLSACVDRPFEPSNPIEPNENNIVINIKNNANFDFYGLQVTILDVTNGSVNADGSKIDKGEVLSYDFLEGEIPLDGEAEMEVAIETDNSNLIPINKMMTIELVNNQGIFFELTGDSIEEADIKGIK